jgi:hypothetical protein
MKAHLLLSSLALLPLAPFVAAQQPIQSAIHFHSDQHDLTALATIVMDTICATADQTIPYQLTISAHTDADGSDAYNDALSQRRAETALATLQGCGLRIQGMTVLTQGESNPVADNSSEIGKARNRRVEIHLQPLAQYPAVASEEPPPPPPAESPRGPSLQAVLSPPPFTVASFDPNQNQWFGDGSGASFFIPKGTFGAKPDCRYTVRWRSFTKLSEVVRGRLATVSPQVALQSAGMGEIEVLQDGKRIQPRTGKGLMMTLPRPQADVNWTSWQGKTGGDGITTWKNSGKEGLQVTRLYKQNKKNPKEPGKLRRRVKVSRAGATSSDQRGTRRGQTSSVSAKQTSLARQAVSRIPGDPIVLDGFTGKGNGDCRITIRCSAVGVDVHSDSTQLVIIHTPSYFFTNYGRSAGKDSHGHSVVEMVPLDCPSWAIVIRSTPQGLELATKLFTPTEDSKMVEGFEFHPVTDQQLDFELDNLGANPTALVAPPQNN